MCGNEWARADTVLERCTVAARVNLFFSSSLAVKPDHVVSNFRRIPFTSD